MTLTEDTPMMTAAPVTALRNLYLALAMTAHVARLYSQRVDVGSEEAVGQPEVCAPQCIAEAILELDGSDCSEMISILGDIECAESSEEYAQHMMTLARWSERRAVSR